MIGLLFAPAALFLGLFFFYPLGQILLRVLAQPGSLTLAQIERLGQVSAFTLWQAALSTLLTLVIGLALAWYFDRFSFRGQNFLRVLTGIPFILPTVVVAAGFSALLGPRGWLNLMLMRLFGLDTPPIAFMGTLTAILTAHVFYNASIVIRLVGNALQTFDPRLEKAARTLGASPWQAWLRVRLPSLRPALFTAAALVFLFDFSSYGVILLLGGPQFATLEVEIATQALSFLNLPFAAWLSLLQLMFTLAFSALYREQTTRSLVAAKLAWQPPQPPFPRQRLLIAAGALFILLFFALPLAALPLRSLLRLEADAGARTFAGAGFTLDYYRELFINRRGSLFYVPPVQAALNSLRFAAQTMIFSLALGFPAALAGRSRLGRWLEPWLMLPLGASAVTLGLGAIVAFSRPLAGRIWLSSPLLLPLMHTTLALPFVIRTLQIALASLPERYREAALVLGASPWQVWLRVEIPWLSRALASAGVFAFTISLGEFGAASLLVRPETPTLPTAIYRFLSQPGGLNYGQAMAMASLLMLLTGLCIALVETWRWGQA